MEGSPLGMAGLQLPELLFKVRLQQGHVPELLAAMQTDEWRLQESLLVALDDDQLLRQVSICRGWIASGRRDGRGSPDCISGNRECYSSLPLAFNNEMIEWGG